jgi:septum formation inhibitor MinC
MRHLVMTPLIKFENHMSDTARPPSVRLRGHSYIANALTPASPITQWLSELDESIDCFADFLVSKPIVLALSKVTVSQSGIAHLIAQLQTRKIHIMGIEGAGELGPELPPVLRGGRAAGPIDGIYRTTEDLEPTLRGRPTQAWFQDDVMFIAPLDESH